MAGLTRAGIDKSSSTELNEAITSMYRWYQKSELCMVYLADVPDKDMYDSDWWSRGFTLQELIGPRDISFHNGQWSLLGTKVGLLSAISSKTGIPKDVLSHAVSPDTYSIAQRMSWAATRRTKRNEDRAYSLLGIFGVFMLPNYGEGDHAFQRLQEMILENSKDESIFAWDMGTGDGQRTYSGLLAPSPSSYINCGDVVKLPKSKGFDKKNGEIRMELKMIPYSMGCWHAALNCTTKTHSKHRVSIFISQLPTADEYVRMKPENCPRGTRLVKTSDLRDLQVRAVRVSVSHIQMPRKVASVFLLRTLKPPGHDDCNIQIISRGLSGASNEICVGDDQWGTAGLVSLEPKVRPGSKSSEKGKGWSQIRWIKFGFDLDSKPMLSMENGHCPEPACTKEMFEQAVIMHPESGTQDKILNNEWIESRITWDFPVRTIYRWTWHHGKSVLKTDDRNKGIAKTFEGLNLEIAVRLVRRDWLSQSIGSNEEKVWVVDIIDTKSQSMGQLCT